MVTNLEIRTCPPRFGGDTDAAAFDAAISEAATQTPEGTTRQVAFVLTWIDGATFVGRVALERERFVGLKARLLELSASRAGPRVHPDELVELARQVRARASLAAVQELLEGHQSPRGGPAPSHCAGAPVSAGYPLFFPLHEHGTDNDPAYVGVL